MVFHCDHFEPWRSVPRTIGPENAELVERFAERTAALDHARRLTLFYRPHCKPVLAPRQGGKFVPGDQLGFLPLDERALETTRPAIRALVAAGHEIQLHIHHERVTGNDRHGATAPWADLLAGEGAAHRDSKRLELLIQLSLATARAESGCSLDEWLLIHGNWALAASDPNVCQVRDELMLLRRNGCVGDFTFTGEPREARCNPNFELPALVRPTPGAKAYDLPAADARAAWGGDALHDAGERLLIWSSAPGRIGQALDYRNEEVARRCADPLAWAGELAGLAVRLGDTLYLPTYAHSMSLQHGAGDEIVFPHELPAVRAMFGHLFDGATAAGLAVEQLTAAEVRREVLRGAEDDSERPPHYRPRA